MTIMQSKKHQNDLIPATQHEYVLFFLVFHRCKMNILAAGQTI